MPPNHTPEGIRRTAERLANRVTRHHLVSVHSVASGEKQGIQIFSQAALQNAGFHSQSFLTRFLRLPPELQFMILSYLEFGDIERLRRTCHFLRNCINKVIIRSLFPDLREEILSTCYLCLTRQDSKVALVRAEETDARYPLASRCFDCVAQRSGFMVGRKYMLGNLMSVWVCRWCGYPVSALPAWNQPEFHLHCFRKYNRVLLLYFLLGCAQWVVVIVGAALCWAYFKHYKLVLGPTIVNFILAFWVFVLSVLRGSVLRTYHWALILEVAILGLWIAPIYSIAGQISQLSDPPPKSTVVTLGFIGANTLFRFLNAVGNLILLFEWKMWRRNKPNASLLSRIINKTMMILVFWADPQSMEQDYPATWWFKRERRRANDNAV